MAPRPARLTMSIGAVTGLRSTLRPSPSQATGIVPLAAYQIGMGKTIADAAVHTYRRVTTDERIVFLFHYIFW